MQPFPHPIDATYKIRPRLVLEIFSTFESASNSKVTDSILAEFELVQDFMPVFVTSKFDEVPIKNERASMETQISHN